MGTGPTNPLMKALIERLRTHATKSESALWRRVADDLEKPARQRRYVNVSQLARVTAPNETVVVPGKVLGAGALPHSVVVAAWDFSEGARKQIAAAKGKCITIDELVKQKPDGKDVRIIG